MLKSIAGEILLVDMQDDKCSGEVLDLHDVLSFSTCSNIKKATSKEAGQADIIIICAGAKQKPGQTRAELFQTNKNVIIDIIKGLSPINPRAILIVVTNPLDALTTIAQKISGLPQGQVFGAGTFLDSQRLRSLIAQEVKVSEQSVNAYVIGEHGDSQFVAWSTAEIGAAPLNNFPIFTQQKLDEIAKKAKDRAYDIINLKGSTFFGIGTCAAYFCEIIIHNKRQVLPLSVYRKEFDVCLSIPVILGEKGVEEALPLNLTTTEKQSLEKSAQAIKSLLT
jgi:L-lactate dehydrogenase